MATVIPDILHNHGSVAIGGDDDTAWLTLVLARASSARMIHQLFIWMHWASELWEARKGTSFLGTRSLGLVTKLQPGAEH